MVHYQTHCRPNLQELQVQTDRIIANLRNVAESYTTLPFDQVSNISESHVFEEVGRPGSGEDYCQIEVEVLDRFMEKDVQVLHLSIVARDEHHEFGVDLFFYSDGRVRWDRVVYEFRTGVPYPIGK